MSEQSSKYWPIFLIVAAISTAAVWKFAPMVPLSQSARSACVRWTHKARQIVGLEPAPVYQHTIPEMANAATVSQPATTAEAKPLPAATQPIAPKTPNVARAVTSGGGNAAVPDDDDEDPLSMTREQRKKRYDELTKLADERRHQILRENLMKSEEGKRALAAVKKFKAFGAEVNELKKKYGETDSRVVSKRGELLKLKDEVRRTNDEYKKWKEAHRDEFKVPEEDEKYRELIGKREMYRN